jgi:predicted nuclease of predicted toxin-antitoxin system
MRFPADENVSAKLLVFLRSLGHDVRSVAKGTADPEITAQAKTESRMILTHDTDFANTDEYPASSHAGILLIRINPLFVEQATAALRKLFAAVSDAELPGRSFLVFEETFVEFDEGESVPSAS